MTRRSKESGSNGPHRPEPPLLAGVMIGLTISTLATGAMILGTGLAIGQSIVKK